MAVQGRSARGEMVDFDLLKIKEQIATAPPSSDVTRRRDFIENKLRRRPKQTPKSVSVVEVDHIPPQVAEPESIKEDEIVKKAEIETATKKPTKQKARTTTKKQEEPNEKDTSTKK
jgi:hypothetical protein